MTVLLRWMEPVEPGRSKPRRRWSDWIIGFAVSAIVGLGIVGQSGPTQRLSLGNQFELSVPAQAWQFGVWLLIFVAGGWFGTWVMSFGGRAEVTVRDNGIGWLLGRATGRFYAYAQMERCELWRATESDFWRLRVTLRPKPSADAASIGEIVLARHIDANRIRDMLQTAGVVTAGWPTP